MDSNALRIGFAAMFVLVVVDARVAMSRQSGIQRTPDNKRILVNKDVGSSRYAITLNLDDGTVTGNVFFTDNDGTTFLSCGSLGNDVFACSGANACSAENRQSGIQRTPDGKRILVNKDVAGARYALTLNPEDGTATGNVFQGEQNPAFIFCTPIGTNTFSCSGADSCITSSCIDQYRFIADVVLPETFFTVPETCPDYSFINNVTLPAGFFDPATGTECDASCVQAQASAVVVRTEKILEIGVAVIGDSSALSGAEFATSPCPDGGSSTDNGNGFTDVNCRNGDLVSNGTVTFVDLPGTQGRQASFEGYSVTRLSTGETLVSSGTLVISPRATGVEVNGTVTRSSNLLGEFTDTFTDVIADTSGGGVALVSGTVVTMVTQGLGEFTHLTLLEANILGPQLTIVLATFDDTTQQVAIVADDIGLCDPCTTNANCNSQLVCQPCVSGCTGTTRRCSVDFENIGAQCVDGLF